MLRSRIIPCLLVKNGGLYKTRKFRDPKYVGDPINAVKIFNEKGVDELIVADIDATVFEKEPNYRLIKTLAAECRMPLCYSGGIKTPDQVERIISLGVEKIGISSGAIDDISIIRTAANRVGSQSIVVVMDVKKTGVFKKYELFTKNGSRKTGLDPVEFSKIAQENGAGEILLNSIDCDGEMKGYDLNLIEQVRSCISIPMTVLGGASSIDDIRCLIDRFGTIGVAAGSFFVFKGKYRAVLINYPSIKEKEKLFKV